jgi:hypothetical protein
MFMAYTFNQNKDLSKKYTYYKLFNREYQPRNTTPLLSLFRTVKLVFKLSILANSLYYHLIFRQNHNN